MEEIVYLEEQEDGSFVVETKGFAGKACQLAANEMAGKLGRSTRVEYKPEYHMQNGGGRRSQLQNQSNVQKQQ